MRLVFRVVKYAVLDFFEEFFLLILFNILWCVSALLLALPLPFATAGLVWVAAKIGEGKAISWRTFFEGGRRHWKPAYLWGLVNLVVWVLIFVNIKFYGNLDVAWALVFRSFILSAAIIWGGMQLYVFPLLIRQEDPSLRLAYRNGLVLMGSQPVLTIVLFLLVIVLLAISLRLAIPLLVLTFALIALLANRAVAEALNEEAARKAS